MLSARVPVWIVAGVVSVVATSGLQAQIRGRGNQEQLEGARNGTRSAPASKEDKRFPLGASWIAVSMNGKPITGTERPAFTLDDQYRMRGFAGCNSFQTTAFPLRDQGIAVGPMALTHNNCDKAVMDREQSFLVALRTAAKWDTVIGTLVLKAPGAELKFERSL